MVDVILVLAGNVHDVYAEQVARDSREGDVHVDDELLAATLVDED